MPVDVERVRIPVRVRVTPLPGGALPVTEVRSAVADAVLRGCRGIDWDLLGLAPTELDSCAAVAVAPTRVPASALTTAALAGAVDGAARAGIRVGSARSGGSAARRPPAQEAFDPTRVRYRPNGMSYVIPYFDGGEIEVPLRDEGGFPAPRVPGIGEIVSVDEAIRIAWAGHLHRNGGPALNREKPGYWGRIRSGRVVFTGFLVIFRAATLGPGAALLPGRFSYSADAWLFGAPGLLGLPGAGGSPWGLFMGPDGIEGWYGDEGADQIPIRFVRQADDPTITGVGDGNQIISVDGPAGTDASVDVAIAVEAPLFTSGPEGPAGRVGGRSESATGAARASWYAPWDATSVPQVCEPFYIEPRMADLADAGGLAEQMRYLAAALGLEECDYLGNFTVTCARSIAGRAHGVAAESIDSGAVTSVTVRPDGGGNNGYVDLRPTASAPLERLRTLARLSRDVSQLARDIGITYQLPANQHLVGVFSDGGGDVGAWLLRFVNATHDPLVFGYRTIFSETCRCIMLQQLRSSSAAIASRREPVQFGRVVEDLGSKLEIIGEAVLWPTALLTALEHAPKVYMTGTVRQVLSASEHVSYGEGADVELPPPIGDIPPRILERVGDARIERRGGYVVVYQDRDWTVDQLRQTINDRRRLLNMTDPLFLQIEDLQSLAARTARDPAHLERFLRNLLSEMASANREMTSRASELDDGAEFALRASQYISLQGGRDWRGMRYALQGIHALADTELRAETAGSYDYVKGVNDALRRLEVHDEMLVIASTIGIVVLGLLCAPLGAVAAAAITAIAGLAFTIHDVLDADRQRDLYRALEDPELFQRWQDVQLAELMATISIAFSIFDVLAIGKAAHAVAREALAAIRIAERTGQSAFRIAGRGVRAGVMRNMTEEFIQNAMRHALQEAVVMAAMNVILPHVIMPVLEPWIRRQAQEHGTLPTAEAALAGVTTRGTR